MEPLFLVEELRNLWLWLTLASLKALQNLDRKLIDCQVEQVVHRYERKLAWF